MPFWCRGCRKYFSLKTNTVMEASNLSLRTWVFGMYIMATNLKGVSSMKIYRELEITQKTAWFMIHRLREGFPLQVDKSTDPDEADEACVGGKK